MSSLDVPILDHPDDRRRGVDFIGVTVCILTHDGNETYLLNKRSIKCRDEQGCWDKIGGAMEFGESFEEAAARELREEIGCDPLSLKFAGARNNIRTIDGKKTHWINLIFTARIDPTAVRINDVEKIDEVQWFKLDKLPTPLHSQFLADLEVVREYRARKTQTN